MMAWRIGTRRFSPDDEEIFLRAAIRIGLC